MNFADTPKFILLTFSISENFDKEKGFLNKQKIAVNFLIKYQVVILLVN